jgi:catechol 2,3-dioxygenase-like lactoylglutathione lyase family enzyme
MKSLLFLACAAVAAAQDAHITGVAHMAVYVHDIAKARAFYHDFLGYEEPYHLDNPDGSLAMTFFKVNERQYIEVFPEKEAATDRLYHIALETDDAEGLRRSLSSKGVKVPEQVAVGRIGNRNFNITDPDGHTVEMVQYMPESWTLRENGKHASDRVSTRIMHVGVLVGALDPALRFYDGTLGFHEFWRGSSGGKVLNWVNMHVPDGDTYIEFMLYDQIPRPPPAVRRTTCAWKCRTSRRPRRGWKRGRRRKSTRGRWKSAPARIASGR